MFRIPLPCAILIGLLGAGLAWADPEDSPPLVASYQQLLTQNTTPPANTPFVVNAIQKDDLHSAEIYSMMDQPIAVVAAALTDVGNWCAFTLLDFNVKACTYQHAAHSSTLTFYLGRKYYQPPSDAHLLTYRYQADELTDQGFSITLHAEEGPMGTEDYQLEPGCPECR